MHHPFTLNRIKTVPLKSQLSYTVSTDVPTWGLKLYPQSFPSLKKKKVSVTQGGEQQTRLLDFGETK